MKISRIRSQILVMPQADPLANTPRKAFMISPRLILLLMPICHASRRRTTAVGEPPTPRNAPHLAPARAVWFSRPASQTIIEVAL